MSDAAPFDFGPGLEVSPSPRRDADYPAWLCRDCGQRYGRRRHAGEAATWHRGKCVLCGEVADVTEPRDFHHLCDNWRLQWGADQARREAAVSEFLPGPRQGFPAWLAKQDALSSS